MINAWPALASLPICAALSISKDALMAHHRARSASKHHPRSQNSPTQQHATYLKAYGKGSQIWPECNEEPISLSASFPSGVIPDVIRNTLDTNTDVPTIHSTEVIEPSSSSVSQRTGKRKVIKRTLKHLLTSAAAASSRRASSEGDTAISKSPLILSVLLVALNCVGIKHILSVVGISVYLIAMTCWASAPSLSGENNVSSLPSKRHVPNLVSNPLGTWANSNLYRIYLRSGALLSLFLPVLILLIVGVKDMYLGGLEGVLPINLKDAFNSVVLARPMNGVVKKLLGGHVFLVCCQVVSEGVGRAALLPLPIRILIPVTYNIARLAALHDWALYPCLTDELVLSTPLRVLGVANLIYWYVNLLFFLPEAVLRYLRAHFYCVEATEVTVRKGCEASVGLL